MVLCFNFSMPLLRGFCISIFLSAHLAAADGNRLTYLDSADPFYVHTTFPKLTTPQWVGETGVQAVVILAIDDMRESSRYETYLRPILDRLKKSNQGQAPLSIMANAINPEDPRFTNWLAEGLSLEVHTLSHPCPLLAGGNFRAAEDTFFGGIELLARIPGNRPVAFRMPCCDSMNSPSPRFYAEIFNQTNRPFLQIDSSVMNLPTPDDPDLPLGLKERVADRFDKYFPRQTNAITRVTMGSFSTVITNYPYPYLIGNLCWEFPGAIPSDWEAHNLRGSNQAETVADWKLLLDLTVAKRGVMNLIFHPHGWIQSTQVVELIDYAESKYGGQVKFLNFRQALERLNENLLGGDAVRNAAGADAGIRLIDLNGDGYLDLVNGSKKICRIWNAAEQKWQESLLPFALDPSQRTSQIRWAMLPGPNVGAMEITTNQVRGWSWTAEGWREKAELAQGLESLQPVHSARAGAGWRFRDLNRDGVSELMVGEPGLSRILGWDASRKIWRPESFSLPAGVVFVDDQGQDAGARFIDLDSDGFDDLLFSNDKKAEVYLFISREVPNLRWSVGWTRKVRSLNPGDSRAPLKIASAGPHPNQGVWFAQGTMWAQNETTANLPDKVDRRSFTDLIAFDSPPAQSPEESLKSIRVAPGFRVELAAHEPQVLDPIAFEWGADGKLWVVEMGDYPSGLDGKGKPGGQIRCLDDQDGDGRYERHTVFLDGIPFPTGVHPWRRGVVVSAAPEIFYAEDTDGDGKADKRQVLFAGFVEGNQQHRVNGFEYSLDNWLYGANGDSGGDIKWVGSLSGTKLAESPSWRLRGHDFRFQPDTGAFELVEGQTQFGRRRDDWGNWFGNNNPAWLWHYALPERYLVRNPNLPALSTKVYLANYPENTKALAISSGVGRFNWPELVNTVTSANSPTPYRDQFFPGEYGRSIFISEPAHNLVHREVLEPHGASFRSRRSSLESTNEFLASSDNWFRPTMIKTGPDGALYLADMYRLVIEHLEYALPGMEKQIEVRAGADRGRIYRVMADGQSRRAVPRLDQLSRTALARQLRHPNGWVRDTAQRLLVDTGKETLGRQLITLFNQSVRESRTELLEAEAKGRLHILGTLDGLNQLTVASVRKGLKDKHPAVREMSVRLSENFLRQEKIGGTLGRELLRLKADPDPRVRFQLAFSLGEMKFPGVAETLAELAEQFSGDELFQQAVLSSSLEHASGMLEFLHRQKKGVALRRQLLELIALKRDEEAVLRAVNATRSEPRLIRWTETAALLRGIQKRKSPGGNPGPEFARQLEACLAEAVGLLKQPAGATEAELLAAFDLLSFTSTPQRPGIDLFVAFLSPRFGLSINQAALRALLVRADSSTYATVFSEWANLTPLLRQQLVQASLAQETGASSLVQALSAKKVPAIEVPAAAQQELINHRSAAIREKARAVFGQIDPDRQRVIDQFAATSASTGDPARGQTVFQKLCLVCHSLKGEGGTVGPDLATLTDKSAGNLLISIIDPNRAVEAPFVNYLARTRSGDEYQGVIVTESGNNVVLKMANGQQQSLLRSELVEFRSSGMSIMPEGLEKGISLQEMADLIRYIQVPGR